MFVKIGDEVINLRQVRSVSQNDDKKTMNFSLMADYDYDIRITPSEAVELFKKAGITILKITETDLIVQDNIVSITPDGDELTIIYKDGADENFYNTKKIADFIQPISSLTEEDVDDDEEENIDVPQSIGQRHSDLREEKPETRSAAGLQVVIVLAFIGLVIYLYTNGFIKS